MTILLMLTSDNHIKEVDSVGFASALYLGAIDALTTGEFIERLKNRKLGDTDVIATSVANEKDLNHIMDLYEQVELRLGMEQKLKDLEPKIVKWEPREFEKNYMIDEDGSVTMTCMSSDNYRLFGNEFETKENAEEQSDRIRAMNLIYQYALEYDGCSNKGLWCVYFSRRTEEYLVDCLAGNDDSLTVITMSRECAEQLANDLNSGRVVL